MDSCTLMYYCVLGAVSSFFELECKYVQYLLYTQIDIPMQSVFIGYSVRKSTNYILRL